MYSVRLLPSKRPGPQGFSGYNFYLLGGRHRGVFQDAGFTCPAAGLEFHGSPSKNVLETCSYAKFDICLCLSTTATTADNCTMDFNSFFVKHLEKATSKNHYVLVTPLLQKAMTELAISNKKAGMEMKALGFASQPLRLANGCIERVYYGLKYKGLCHNTH